jgi:hypothetical protein
MAGKTDVDVKAKLDLDKPLFAPSKKILALMKMRLITEVKVVPGEPCTYELTPAGEELVVCAARIGMPVAEVAALMGRSEEWLATRMKEAPKLQQLFDSNDAFGKAELRAAQHILAHSNAAMSIHLGKVRLRQTEEPVKTEHTIFVVGASPQFTDSSESWLKKFAPPSAAPAELLVEAEADTMSAEEYAAYVRDSGAEDEA